MEGFCILQVLIYLDFVWFNELCIGIDIVDILVSQCHPVAPVQWANVVVHRRLHGLPIVFHCVQTEQLSVESEEWQQVTTDEACLWFTKASRCDVPPSWPPGSVLWALTCLVELPAELACVLQGRAQQGRLVHQLLGNAAHVHTCSTEPWSPNQNTSTTHGNDQSPTKLGSNKYCITCIQLGILKWKYHTPGGSLWCGHNIVQYHDLLPQYSSFL